MGKLTKKAAEPEAPGRLALERNWRQQEILACVSRLQGKLFMDESRTQPQTRKEILAAMCTSFYDGMTLDNWEFLADATELWEEEPDGQQ